MGKIKLQIKSIWGSVLFEYEKENNTIKDTLIEAIKRRANLRRANLSGADLRRANLSDADLSDADLRRADLSGADLRRANLRRANLSDADLRRANLSDADLSGADLSGADANESTTMFFSQCPDGEFIGWKKASNKIVKLLILEDSKRSSATSLKCRCSKAKVLNIEEYDGSDAKERMVKSNYDNSFIYEKDKIVEVDDFNDDRWNECSAGIHFFISREMAVKY